MKKRENNRGQVVQNTSRFKYGSDLHPGEAQVAIHLARQKAGKLAPPTRKSSGTPGHGARHRVGPNHLHIKRRGTYVEISYRHIIS